MANYDLLNQDKAKNEDTETAPCDCGLVKPMPENSSTRKVSDLTIAEYKKLWIECYEELEQHKQDTSMAEYNRLTAKPIAVSDISTRAGVPVPKEY